MRDKLHQELEVGDYVIYNITSLQRIAYGRIYKICKKMIKVQAAYAKTFYSKYPEDLVKINEQIIKAKKKTPWD